MPRCSRGGYLNAWSFADSRNSLPAHNHSCHSIHMIVTGVYSDPSVSQITGTIVGLADKMPVSEQCLCLLEIARAAIGTDFLLEAILKHESSDTDVQRPRSSNLSAFLDASNAVSQSRDEGLSNLIAKKGQTGQLITSRRHEHGS